MNVRATLFGLLASISISFSVPASSATWYIAAVGNEETRFFFDADTVVKSGDSVLVWIKLVQTRTPDKSDGSWATAIRWRFSCSKRTIQVLSMSTYDSAGTFIESIPTSEKSSEVTPDSTGEAMLKIACQPDFPKRTNSASYSRLADNDVFAATRRWIESYLSRQDPAPR